MNFSDKCTRELQSIVEQAVSGPDGVPGAAVVVLARDGSELFVHAAGKRGISSTEDMTPDNVFWMASCTKMITAVACMQQVEKGVLNLDDSKQLENLCPEFKSLKVLGENGELEPKRNGITLRMLLTHTSGFGYSFFNERLRDWSFPIGIDEFSGDVAEFNVPLLSQPGERWEYGIGLDWAGIALERATGTRLNDYIQNYICRPLGLENINMIPTQQMREKLAYMHQRAANGTLSTREHLLRRPLIAQTQGQRDALFHSGGGGIFANPKEYCRILCVLLNDGVCPTTNVKLLGKATVDEMFRNSIPNLPQFGRQGIPGVKPDLTNPLPDLYPTEGNSPQGWGLSFMLTSGATGRSASTGWWAGLANLFWWADRESGVAGVVCSQILPFGDPKALSLWMRVESGIYEALQSA